MVDEVNFAVHKEPVEVNGVTYLLPPVNGVHYEKFFELLQAVDRAKPKEKFGDEEKEQAIEKFFENLKPSDMKLVHELVVTSLCQEYPSQDKAAIEGFVSQNIMRFLMALLKVNMGK